AGRPAELATFLAESADVAACEIVAARERAARAADEAVAAGIPDARAAAEGAWRAVLAADPGLAEAHTALERLARAGGDPAARDAVLRAKRPASAARPRRAGLAGRRAGLAPDRPDAAQEVLEEVLAADAVEPRAAAKLARLHAAAGRWGDVADVWAARAEALP